VQPVPKDLIATLGVSETMIAVTTLEPGITGSFAILQTTEEGVKGFVKPFERILLHLVNSRRGDRSPRLCFRTGRATFTASWLLSQKAFVIGIR
jgi:hypothetical protein